MDSFRIAVRRVAVTLALPTVALGAMGFAAQGLCADPPADRDAHDLVLLAPAHPVFIRMAVQVDGRGLKSVRTDYAAQLVKQYDKNGDGLLNREEAKAMPPLVKSQNANEMVAIADRWEAVDVNPADDSVSLDELAAYVDRVFGSTFLLSVKPARATQNVDLFSLLDLNHDGRLTRDELLAAPQTLHKLDIDDDETFTVDELQPYRNPQIPQAPVQQTNQATDQPFLLVEHDDESLAKVAQQLQQRYGEATPGVGSLSISREVLGIDPVVFASHDADGNGRLDAKELTAYLQNPEPQIVIEAELRPSKKGVKPNMAVVEDHVGAAAKPMPGATPKLALAVSGIDMELRLPTNKASNDKNDNRNFYKTEFIRAGGSKKGYLSEQEFGALRLPGAEFKAVDRNGDGMVVLDELLAYVEQESTSSQSRVELSISHDGSSVFEIIDLDNDRRLSHRELADAFKRLLKFDRDGDESITAVELAGRFNGTLELGRPMIFRGPGMAARQDNSAPVVRAITSGPEWFRRMDRNRDGDVSWREFLGPLAAFKKLDADGDGLITAAEAEVAGDGQSAGAR